MQDYGDFNLVGAAKNSIDGLNHILKFVPDLVIIHLNELASENLKMVSELHQFMHKLPVLIGFSKSRDHAYEAIKYGFFDYWLLPHNEFEMRKTILRLRKQMPKENVPTTICCLLYTSPSPRDA